MVGVTSGSPASRAGVLVGDVLLEFDGHPVESPEELLDLLLGDRVGKPVAIKLLRGGARGRRRTVTVGERPVPAVTFQMADFRFQIEFQIESDTAI